MEEWDDLDRAVGEMAGSGNAEVREDGEWLAELSSFRCELQGKQSLVHVWSDDRNFTRRIVRVKERFTSVTLRACDRHATRPSGARRIETSEDTNWRYKPWTIGCAFGAVICSGTSTSRASSWMQRRLCCGSSRRAFVSTNPLKLF